MITSSSLSTKWIVYTIHFVVRFGDMDTSAGRSTEARGLPHAFPAYDPRDTVA